MLRNRLFWEIADKRNSDPSPRELRSLDSSFSRALLRLCQDKEIRIDQRKLETVADFRSDYPFRTKDLKVRKLRETFVPLLAERLETLVRSTPTSDGEARLLNRRAAQDPAWFGRQREGWLELEARLLNPGDLSVRARKALVEVLAKGREYFEGRFSADAPQSSASPIHVRNRSLHELLRNLREAGYDTSDLEVSYQQVFPEPEVRHVEFKRGLHAIARISRGSRSSLLRETKQWLLERDPAAVRALPGHSDTRTVSHPRRHVSAEHTRFSPELDQLVDVHVFDAFEYLVPPSQGCA